MNALHPLAVYAAVQAHKGEPLHYPGDIEAWQARTLRPCRLMLIIM